MKVEIENLKAVRDLGVVPMIPESYSTPDYLKLNNELQVYLNQRDINWIWTPTYPSVGSESPAYPYPIPSLDPSL